MASHVPYFRCMCLNVEVVWGVISCGAQSRAKRTRSARLDGGRASKAPSAVRSRFYPDPTGWEDPFPSLLTEIDRHCQYSVGGNFVKVGCCLSPPFGRLEYFSLHLHYFKFVLCKEVLVAGKPHGRLSPGEFTLVQSGSGSILRPLTPTPSSPDTKGPLDR